MKFEVFNQNNPEDDVGVIYDTDKNEADSKNICNVKIFLYSNFLYVAILNVKKTRSDL